MAAGTQYASELVVTASQTIPITADIVLVDCTAGAVTVTLYSPQGMYPGNIVGGVGQGGRVRVVKTDAGGNAVTVATASGSIIGLTSITAQNQSRLYEANGISRWYS